MSGTVATIFGICFIFLMTCLGSSFVFLTKKGGEGKHNVFLSNLAGGIMLASSFFSLLLPALSSSDLYGDFAFLPICLGFLLGALFMFLLDYFLNKIKRENKFEGKRLSKNQKVFIAISLHNIPEGLSVGVALGSAFVGVGSMSILTALSLAIGIGIQNIPEGFAVAMPVKEEGGSRAKAFTYGVFSGILEPIFALLGFFLSSAFTAVLPWLLAFAGGTMIYTILNEIMPSTADDKSGKGVWGFIVGFVIMMLLDVAFG